MIFDKIKNLKIYQIGVGGTGSWVVNPTCKFLNNIQQRYPDILLEYCLIDGDIVEDRNIIRQNFLNMDISQNKARVHVRRNKLIFNNIYYKPVTINKKNIKELIKITHNRNQLTIILGCVDCVKTRKLIYDYCKQNLHRIIYIDSGNSLHNGQITTFPFLVDDSSDSVKTEYEKVINKYRKQRDKLLDNAGLSSIYNKIDIPKVNDIDFKIGLNILMTKLLYKFNNTVYTPKKFNEVFNNSNNTTTDDSTQSCAFFGDQSQSINMMAANILFMCLQKIIIENTLPPPYIEFNSTGRVSYEI